MSGKITKIEVKGNEDNEVDVCVIRFNGIRILADEASIDNNDTLDLYRNMVLVANVPTKGVPFGIPNMVQRAVKYGESDTWEYSEE